MSLDNIKRIHFIGVGGIGMSGLARLFLHEGKAVSGSDRAPSDITAALEKEGVRFFGSQIAENIESGIDMVVYTEAMAKDHPEMVAAKALKVPMVNYFEALGLVANQYYLIAVAGTHGKTTTTAMLIDILEEAELDPTAIVGSLRSKTHSNFRAGKSKYFVVEACEYRRDFMHLEPDVLVITNIEAEHLDYYKDLPDIQSAFRELALKVPEDGAVVVQTADSSIQPVIKDLKCQVIDYKQNFDLTLPLKVPGVHNLLNAAAATAAAKFIAIRPDKIKSALQNFSGTWRRFEYKGTVNGAPVYDDYGHHPTELRATMSGARELYPGKRLVVAFQPHLYSRTAELFNDFVVALAAADRVILTHVYDARNTGKAGVTGETLAKAVKAKNGNTEYVDDFADIVSLLKNTVTSDDVVLVMGAGDLNKIAVELTKSI